MRWTLGATGGTIRSQLRLSNSLSSAAQECGMRLSSSSQALHRNGHSPTSPDHHLTRLRGRTKSLFEAQAAAGIP
jgi:hypothetical protein